MADTDPAPGPDFAQVAELEELRHQLVDLQQRLKTSKARTADLVEAVFQGAKAATVIAGKPSVIKGPVKDRRAKRAEVCWMPCADWHFGKQTPSFDSEVAARRVERLAAKVASITEIERADHPVRECHVLLIGDFTEGLGIFPGQSYEVDSTLYEQMMNAAKALEGFLASMLVIFEKVHVWCQTGNHGRIGRRGDMARGDNTDRLLYRIVSDRFDGQPSSRMVWHHPTSWYTVAEVQNYRALLVHGDQIKSFGGTPIFAILKKTNSWASGVLPAFRDVWMGHFHVDLRMSLANGAGKVFVSPSIESDSAYAEEVIAAASQPAQRLCYVDPVKGRVTAERLVWLS